MNFKYNIDKVGIFGAVLCTSCCLGFSAVIGFLSAIGAGFLVKHDAAPPLLAISLTISFLGIFLSFLKHKNIYPLIITIASSMVLYVFLFIIHTKVLIYVGLSGLIISSVYNFSIIKKCRIK